MRETRIKISSIIQNQLPEFVKEEFPLVSEFLSQYYVSLESKGHTSDILQNIDQYIKVDNLTNLIQSTKLSSNVTFFDTTISVDSTLGFPDSYGLILIDSEIITYTSKTSTSFEGCIRGFNGTTSYEIKDQLSFSETQACNSKNLNKSYLNSCISEGVLFFNDEKLTYIPIETNRSLPRYFLKK